MVIMVDVARPPARAGTDGDDKVGRGLTRTGIFIPVLNFKKNVFNT